jgi:CubicO group peptidase (beta-lactamase class C family)
MLRRDLFFSLAVAALRQDKLQQADALIGQAVARGEVAAASLHVRQGTFGFRRAYGLAKDPDAVFLLASISKPMSATAVMTLVDRGALSLDDPVSKFIAEFQGGDRGLVTVKHLLTHTSGLPDMPPDNTKLRKRHAPLSAFVASTCRAPLLFRPGTEVRYQSMGILLAAEIAQRITGTPFRDFLRRQVFAPLGMTSTSLGLGGRKISDTMPCQVPEHTDWDWNSPYWRDLGAPWGGVHSTASDVIRFLDVPYSTSGLVLKPQTAASMVQIQTPGLNEAWGLGWMRQPGRFGKQCSDRTYGHYGATGTVAWADPRSNLSCVLLTTRPADQSRAGLLGPVSDLVSASAA